MSDKGHFRLSKGAGMSASHRGCVTQPPPIAEVRLGSRSRFGLQLRKFTLRPLNVSLTHHKASIGQTYMLAQKRFESAFLCIVQTFVEWLGGIREFFKLDRDCIQLDRNRLELFSPFS
jgi:hypothetical protein